MTKVRGIIYAVVLSVLSIWLYGLRHQYDKKTQQEIHSTVLPAQDTAKVIVDPARHTLTTVTRSATGQTQTRATFLPLHGASVEVNQNGALLVTAPQWGDETSLFAGGALGSDLKAHATLGFNLVYYTRWELGVGVLLNQNVHDIRAFAHVSYNVYENYYVAVGVDNQRIVQLMAGLKF